MKTMSLILILLSLKATAAVINLGAGESITVKPQEETTVVCAGPGASGSKSKNAKSQTCVAVFSDEACKGHSVGEACRKDESKGSCVAETTIHGTECRCLL